MADEVTSEERGALLFVRLELSEKRNALTRAMLERLGEIFAGVASRADLRAVILSGSGRDFCAGTDISELENTDEAGALAGAALGREVCEQIELCGTPVIAAVQGAAVGAGGELALACHLRVISSDARLGDVSAEEAFRLGLVNRVVEPDRLFAEAEALAQSVIDNAAPLAARACLHAVTRGARLPLDEALRLEAELFAGLFATEDVKEGTRAFLEKRKPVFKGQ